MLEYYKKVTELKAIRLYSKRCIGFNYNCDIRKGVIKMIYQTLLLIIIILNLA